MQSNWGQYPIIGCSLVKSRISIPSNIIEPLSGIISFEKHLNEVVFPEPFLPSKQKHSPLDTLKEILFNIVLFSFSIQQHNLYFK